MHLIYLLFCSIFVTLTQTRVTMAREPQSRNCLSQAEQACKQGSFHHGLCFSSCFRFLPRLHGSVHQINPFLSKLLWLRCLSHNRTTSRPSSLNECRWFLQPRSMRAPWTLFQRAEGRYMWRLSMDSSMCRHCASHTAAVQRVSASTCPTHNHVLGYWACELCYHRPRAVKLGKLFTYFIFKDRVSV